MPLPLLKLSTSCNSVWENDTQQKSYWLSASYEDVVARAWVRESVRQSRTWGLCWRPANCFPLCHVPHDHTRTDQHIRTSRMIPTQTHTHTHTHTYTLQRVYYYYYYYYSLPDLYNKPERPGITKSIKKAGAGMKAHGHTSKKWQKAIQSFSALHWPAKDNKTVKNLAEKS